MPTWTPANKPASAWSGTAKPTLSASAGLYYGFGPFTYSGGQSFGPAFTEWEGVTKP